MNIAKVAEQFDLTSATLRYYEQGWFDSTGKP